MQDVLTNTIKDQKQSEFQQLKQRVEELENFIENANIAMHWVGEDGTILWANKAELDFMGYESEDYIGHKINEFHADEPVIEDILKRLANNEKLQAYPARVVTAKGEVRNVEIYSSVKFNEQNKFVHTRCFTYDVTEKLLAEKAIKESRDRFKLMTDAVPQIIWTTTPDGKTDYLNKQGRDYAQLTDDEVLENKLLEKCLYPLDAEKVMDQWEKSIKSGQGFEMEFRLVRQVDQVVRWHLCRAFCHRDDDGNILFWAGTCTDIDDQRRMMDKLTVLGERLETLVDERTTLLEEAQMLAKVGSWVYDVKYGIFNLTDEMKSIYGLPIEKNFISFDEFLNLRQTSDKELVKEQIGNAISNKSSFEYENTLISDDGPKIIFVRGRVKCNQKGEVEQVVGTVQDITESKVIENKLKENNMELQRSNEELESFAYVASHDLKEPLRMISSYIQLIEKKLPGDSEELNEYMGFVKDGSVRMQALIDDLLKYSRIGRDKNSQFESIDMNEIADYVVKGLEVKIRENDAKVLYDKLPHVKGSNSMISQLLSNLISNAIKFHGTEPPVIKIAAEKKGNKWLFSVKDNSIGIDPVYFKKIFMLFQRLHTPDKYPGTGIGLAISKKIVELHGGEIWLESEPGKGTTFYFTLPA